MISFGSISLLEIIKEKIVNWTEYIKETVNNITENISPDSNFVIISNPRCTACDTILDSDSSVFNSSAKTSHYHKDGKHTIGGVVDGYVDMPYLKTFCNSNCLFRYMSLNPALKYN